MMIGWNLTSRQDTLILFSTAKVNIALGKSASGEWELFKVLSIVAQASNPHSWDSKNGHDFKATLKLQIKFETA